MNSIRRVLVFITTCCLKCLTITSPYIYMTLSYKWLSKFRRIWRSELCVLYVALCEPRSREDQQRRVGLESDLCVWDRGRAWWPHGIFQFPAYLVLILRNSFDVFTSNILIKHKKFIWFESSGGVLVIINLSYMVIHHQSCHDKNSQLFKKCSTLGIILVQS